MEGVVFLLSDRCILRQLIGVTFQYVTLFSLDRIRIAFDCLSTNGSLIRDGLLCVVLRINGGGG